MTTKINAEDQNQLAIKFNKTENELSRIIPDIQDHAYWLGLARGMVEGKDNIPEGEKRNAMNDSYCEIQKILQVGERPNLTFGEKLKLTEMAIHALIDDSEKLQKMVEGVVEVQDRSHCNSLENLIQLKDQEIRDYQKKYEDLENDLMYCKNKVQALIFGDESLIKKWVDLGEKLVMPGEDLESKQSPELKVIDMSVLKESKIDCEFGPAISGEIYSISPLVNINKDGLYEDDFGDIHTSCKPRMDYWHSWNGGNCPLPPGFLIKARRRNGDLVDFQIGNVNRINWGPHHKFNSSERFPYDIMGFMVTGVADGYCLSWQTEENLEENFKIIIFIAETGFTIRNAIYENGNAEAGDLLWSGNQDSLLQYIKQNGITKESIMNYRLIEPKPDNKTSDEKFMEGNKWESSQLSSAEISAMEARGEAPYEFNRIQSLDEAQSGLNDALTLARKENLLRSELMGDAVENIRKISASLGVPEELLGAPSKGSEEIIKLIISTNEEYGFTIHSTKIADNGSIHRGEFLLSGNQYVCLKYIEKTGTCIESILNYHFIAPKEDKADLDLADKAITEIKSLAQCFDVHEVKMGVRTSTSEPNLAKWKSIEETELNVWYEWGGNHTMPAKINREVFARLRNGSIKNGMSREFKWRHHNKDTNFDIVAFKVV